MLSNADAEAQALWLALPARGLTRLGLPGGANHAARMAAFAAQMPFYRSFQSDLSFTFGFMPQDLSAVPSEGGNTPGGVPGYATHRATDYGTMYTWGRDLALACQAGGIDSRVRFEIWNEAAPSGGNFQAGDGVFWEDSRTEFLQCVLDFGGRGIRDAGTQCKIALPVSKGPNPNLGWESDMLSTAQSLGLPLADWDTHVFSAAPTDGMGFLPDIRKKWSGPVTFSEHCFLIDDLNPARDTLEGAAFYLDSLLEFHDRQGVKRGGVCWTYLQDQGIGQSGGKGWVKRSPATQKPIWTQVIVPLARMSSEERMNVVFAAQPAGVNAYATRGPSGLSLLVWRRDASGPVTATAQIRQPFPATVSLARFDVQALRG